MKKKMFIVWLFALMPLALPVQAKWYEPVGGYIIRLTEGHHDNPDWYEDNRSLSYAPVAAYDNQAVYLYACEVMQDVTITVTDNQGCVVASAVVTVFPEQPAVLTLDAGSGSYRLDVVYKGNCYYGYFEM